MSYRKAGPTVSLFDILIPNEIAELHVAFSISNISGIHFYEWRALFFIMSRMKRRASGRRKPARHLQLAIRNENELNILLSDVISAQGGVLPNVYLALLPKPSNQESTSKQTDDPKRWDIPGHFYSLI
ncbi:Uncharacterized protein BM_BM8721 [Brugia malayi]|uniref:Bm8721 n=1 Tax=Brugia malayi TaxID=6279 RepID=A0A0J9Y7D5_BRUMA|nr:Uncharacterized protein BM_BM8721 [Brugia malayi]CDQ03384.1 Bm8721 [Brugia malayi]VIO87700.1 Uncharacterized protein BM_BM8721 [Brugia malayi]